MKNDIKDIIASMNAKEIGNVLGLLRGSLDIDEQGYDTKETELVLALYNVVIETFKETRKG